jgi:hypothetical protein
MMKDRMTAVRAAVGGRVHGWSFGFVAADRGLKTRGPYALVRHPIYASYLLIQSRYVLQNLSLRNIAVVVLATVCNIGRAIPEERLLARSPAYRAYQQRVRWRLRVPAPPPVAFPRLPPRRIPRGAGGRGQPPVARTSLHPNKPDR